jgi:DNA-binding PadR family transcriptional regulator
MSIIQVFQGSLANVWPATQSQLYAELGRLADSGLVTVSAEGARGRKEYALTDEGLAELRHWLVDVEPNSVRRSDMLLRVFFLDVVDADQAEDYLRSRVKSAIDRHDQLQAVRDGIPDEPDNPLVLYGLIAMEWGLRFSAMQQEWAEWATEEVVKARGRS